MGMYTPEFAEKNVENDHFPDKHPLYTPFRMVSFPTLLMLLPPFQTCSSSPSKTPWQDVPKAEMGIAMRFYKQRGLYANMWH